MLIENNINNTVAILKTYFNGFACFGIIWAKDGFELKGDF